MSALLQTPRHQQQDSIAVDKPAVVRHEHRPVAVSVIRDTEIRRRIHHHGLQGFHVHCATAGIDVRSVGRSVSHDHIRAEFLQRSWSDFAHRAVRAIKHDAHSIEPVPFRKVRQKNLLITFEPARRVQR